MDAPAPTAVPRASPAVLLLVTAMVAFSLQDVLVKLVTEGVSLWQMQAVRSLSVVAILLVFLRLSGRGSQMWPHRLRWPLVRAGVLSGAYLFFYASLPFLTLAEAGSGFFTAPILITLLGAVLMGERLGPRRVAALAIGFVGVLCIVKPGLAGFNPLMVMPLLAALCYAFGVILTRWRCAGEAPWALAMVSNVLYAAIGIVGILIVPLLPLGEAFRAAWPFLTGGWLAAGWGVLGIVVLTGLTHMTGAVCSAKAYQAADAGRIAPFEYVYLALTPLWDIAVWGLWPDPATGIGMLLICVAGSFSAWDGGQAPARRRVG